MTGPWRIDRLTTRDSAARDYDLEIVNTDGFALHVLWTDGPYTCSAPLVFKALGQPDTLGDYPFVISWPLFSARLADLFGDTVTRLPTTVRWGRHRDSTSFVVCTPCVLTDGLDTERSEFIPNRFRPTARPTVVRPVLRSDVAWPRLFRLREHPVDLFVNHETRLAIEALGARGVAFHPVDVTDGSAPPAPAGGHGGSEVVEDERN